MSQTMSYFELGASLYTPCTHPRLGQIMKQGISAARSLVFCTEDAVNADELDDALCNLSHSLASLTPGGHFRRFVRPRNVEVLRQILAMKGVEKLDGFVLPKADSQTLPAYRALLNTTTTPFVVMPTLETAEVLDQSALAGLRNQLDRFSQQILCLRIGGNDLLNLMGLKRLPGLTAYDTPLRTVIEQLVIGFRPHGYELSAPVFDFIDDRSTLINEVNHDISYGLLAKTAIHPVQLAVIEQQYALYTERHIEQARAVLSDDAKGVFRLNGQMMERTCHANWAIRTLALADQLTHADTICTG